MKSGIALAAEKLLAEFGVRKPEHIRLEDIAWELGIEIVEGDLAGCAAQLSLFEKRARIRLPRNRGERGRVRFSIAHELGHLVLHKERMLACTESNLDDWHGDQAKERDANVFAAELLLPAKLVDSYVNVDDVSFEPIKALARAFDTSLTAAAIRFVELTASACAVVSCAKGRIEWVKRGEEFWLRTCGRGEAVDDDSLAHRAAASGASPAHPDEVAAQCWLDDDRTPDGAVIMEDVVAMPAHGRTLSLLWLHELEAPEDA